MLYRNLPQLSLLFLTFQSAIASPLSSNFADLVDLQNNTISKRGENCCGYWGLCCGPNAVCYTDINTQAQCATTSMSGAGYWQYYTSVWVETDTITKTKTYSSYIAQAVATTTAYVAPISIQTGGAVACSSEQHACGNICCASSQYCLVSGQCATAAPLVTTTLVAPVVVTTLFSSYSAPLRPTSSGVVTVTVKTTTASPTVAFIVASATGSANAVTLQNTSTGGLSGGAIAGIVIGILFIVFLLFLLCLYFCFKAGWEGLTAIFGIGSGGRRKKVREERRVYHRNGSRAESRSWYGSDGPRRPQREKKSSGGGLFSGFTGVAAGLAGLAAVLGLSRANDRKRRDEKSEYSDDYSDTTYSTEYTRSDDRKLRS